MTEECKKDIRKYNILEIRIAKRRYKSTDWKFENIKKVK